MNAYLFKIYYQFLWSYYHYRIPKQACSFKIRWLRQTRQGAYSNNLTGSRALLCLFNILRLWYNSIACFYSCSCLLVCRNFKVNK